MLRLPLVNNGITRLVVGRIPIVVVVVVVLRLCRSSKLSKFETNRDFEEEVVVIVQVDRRRRR